MENKSHIQISGLTMSYIRERTRNIRNYKIVSRILFSGIPLDEIGDFQLISKISTLNGTTGDQRQTVTQSSYILIHYCPIKI